MGAEHCMRQWGYNRNETDGKYQKNQDYQQCRLGIFRIIMNREARENPQQGSSLAAGSGNRAHSVCFLEPLQFPPNGFVLFYRIPVNSSHFFLSL